MHAFMAAMSQHGLQASSSQGLDPSPDIDGAGGSSS